MQLPYSLIKETAYQILLSIFINKGNCILSPAKLLFYIPSLANIFHEVKGKKKKKTYLLSF